ncbi:MAG: VanZ family protein [Planctomycetota bacterium]|jgi:VanZ family protein
MHPMKLLRRHKSILIALGIYWPVIFWLTHIPVPDIARQSGMSDKTMHVIAYFVLTFLIWFAISPYEKVNWKRKKVWILLAVVVWYGALDEYLQGRVGRSADVMDFVADLFGMVLALGILSIFGFWSSLLTASAAFVFVISNKSDLLLLYPQYHLNTAFHLTAYTAFTLIWIQHAERFNPIRIGSAKWALYALSMPVGLLVLIMGISPLFGRTVWWPDVATALFGIASAILVSWGVFTFSHKQQNPA